MNNESYRISEQFISMEDSTDMARMLTIYHSKGTIILTFLFGNLIKYEENSSSKLEQQP